MLHWTMFKLDIFVCSRMRHFVCSLNKALCNTQPLYRIYFCKVVRQRRTAGVVRRRPGGRRWGVRVGRRCWPRRYGSSLFLSLLPLTVSGRSDRKSNEKAALTGGFSITWFSFCNVLHWRYLCVLDFRARVESTFHKVSCLEISTFLKRSPFQKDKWWKVAFHHLSFLAISTFHTWWFLRIHKS